MVKNSGGQAPTGPGIYSATYSGIPVYEFQFGADLKEHVMRRRQDDWINATHILKAAGYDKPARTRILEREVQKDVHEKIQGGYGKYQGTWIPLEAGQQLAEKNNVYDLLRPIFEYMPGNQSPPPAPRHASKPKAPKSKPPPVPAWTAPRDDYDIANQQMNDDETPDNVTVASASYMAEDDRYDMSHYSTGHRKRKREEPIQDLTEQQHRTYANELLDYFVLYKHNQNAVMKPEPPPNFMPDWPIDNENHRGLHWASAMGDVDAVRQFKRFGADVRVRNIRGETPLMRTVGFVNTYESQTFEDVLNELFESIDARDNAGCTVVHHAAVMKSGRTLSHTCARYYLGHILTKIHAAHGQDFMQQLVDIQDEHGNTALHLAAQAGNRKCVRALIGYGASSVIPNGEGVIADDLIKELNNASKSHRERQHQRSSSPFAPDSERRVSVRDALAESVAKFGVTYQSEAANSVQDKITPLVLEKFQDLAQSYEQEWKDKSEAESEARLILANTQNDLAAVRQEIAELEGRLQPEPLASKAAAEAAAAQEQLLSLVTSQNQYHIQASVEQQVSMINGDVDGDDSAEVRLQLAHELTDLIMEQHRAEQEYVDALGMSGTGETIDKYRRLLKQCLDHDDAENLDANLDDLIEMMEEDRHDAVAPPPPAEAMILC